MVRPITVNDARTQIHGAGEVAFLDIREAGPFSMGHPLFAVPCPYSTLELTVPALVPRPTVPVVLIDGGDGVAERAGAAMERMGYADVSAVDGGTPAWEREGHTLFQGVNVPCKLLGELVGELWAPRRIGPDELAQWQRSGAAFDFYDCRPPTEFAKMTVPGAASLPNGEIAHRLPAVSAGGRPILLTCAGRTRGLIGAASLAAVAPEIEVLALENGTQGWALSGRELVRGSRAAPMPELDAAGRAETSRRAEAFLAREGLSRISAEHVPELLADSGRTTYLLDVRSEAEVVSDPLPAFAPALSVQVVQASDRWIGVRRSRVVLADDLGLRAAIAAYWLRMLGFEPFVLPVDDRVRSLPPRPVPRSPAEDLPMLDPAEALSRLADGGAVAVDVRSSEAYRAGHLAGARWLSRPAAPAEISRDAGLAVVIGDGSGRAALVASDLQRAGRRVAVVRGGHAALAAAGAAVETSTKPEPTVAPDVTWFAHGRHDGDLDASRLYLAWELGLEHQLDPAERAEFAI